MNHGVQVRIQLALILRQLGLPKDLRQLIIKKVWFSCQSECLRLERIWAKENIFQQKPIYLQFWKNNNVAKCSSRCTWGTIARTPINGYWFRNRYRNVDEIIIIMNQYHRIERGDV